MKSGGGGIGEAFPGGGGEGDGNEVKPDRFDGTHHSAYRFRIIRYNILSSLKKLESTVVVPIYCL